MPKWLDEGARKLGAQLGIDPIRVDAAINQVGVAANRVGQVAEQAKGPVNSLAEVAAGPMVSTLVDEKFPQQRPPEAPPQAPPQGPPQAGVGWQQAPSGPPVVQMGGGPVRAGFVPTARAIQSGVELSPETLGHLGNFEKSTMQGVDLQAQGEREKSEFLGRRAGYEANQQAADAAIAKTAEDRRHSQEAWKRLELDDSLRDLENSKVDPDKYTKSLGTGQRLLGLVGMALGGFNSGYRGGPNQFAEFLNKSIDRSIEAQRDEISKKKFLVEGKRAALGELRQEHGTERLEEEKQRAMAYASFMKELDAQAARFDDPLIQARAAQARAAAEKGLFESRAKYEELAQPKVTTHEAYRVTGGPGRAMPKLDEARFIATGPNGQGVYAPTPEEGQKLRDRMAITNDLTHTINKALEVRAAVHSGRMDPLTGARELNRLQSGAMQRFNTMNGGGALNSGHEVGNAKSAIGSIGPMLLADPTGAATAKGAIEDLGYSTQQRLGSLPTVQSGFAATPNGVQHVGGVSRIACYRSWRR